MTAELALTVEQTAATTVTRRAVGLLRPTIGIVVVSVLCFVVLVGGFTDVGLVDARAARSSRGRWAASTPCRRR